MGKGSENSSLFEEEIKKEKGEMNKEKNTDNYETKSLEESDEEKKKMKKRMIYKIIAIMRAAR